MKKNKLYKIIYNKLIKSYNLNNFQLVTSDIKILDFLIFIQYLFFSNINIVFIRKNRSKKLNYSKIEGNLDNKDILVIENMFDDSSNISYIEKSLELKGRKINKIFIIFLDKNLRYDYNIKYFLEKKVYNISDIEHKNDIKLIYKSKNQNLSNLYKKNSLQKIENGFLFVDDLGKLIKFDISFNIIWEKFFSNETFITFKPIVIKDKIYIITVSGELYEIGIEKGNIINIYNICDNVFTNLVYSKDRKEIYIYGVNNSINNKYYLYSFNLESKFIQGYLIGSEIISNIIYINNKIIYGTNNQELNIFNFDKIYKININGNIIGGFEKYNNNLIFCTNAGYVYEYSLYNNKVINVKKITEYWMLSKPLFINNYIIVTSVDKKMYILDKSLNIIDIIKTKGRIFSNPIKISEKLIFFGSNDSRGYLYNIETRKIKYYQFSERIISEPVYYDNKLYIQDFLNNIYHINK